MTDLDELMQQARRMQEQFNQAQQQRANEVVEGESGAGLVKVSLNGKYEVMAIKLDPALLQEEKAVIEDLIAAAFNAAVGKLEESNQTTLHSLVGSIDLPGGFRFPS